jgi:hypothetical protein
MVLICKLGRATPGDLCALAALKNPLSPLFGEPRLSLLYKVIQKPVLIVESCLGEVLPIYPAHAK